MPFLHLAVLALVQGVTEFLPVSSSGHLILVPAVLGWPDQGLDVDVAVHVGTLGAVMLYFWRDVARMLGGAAALLAGRRTAGGRLVAQVVLATLPVVAAGYYMKAAGWSELVRRPEIIAWTTLGFGVVLGVADRIGMTIRRLEHMRYGAALFIGLAQVLALIPGTSRSGITMTAARLLGYERPDAARFSMLLSMPTIFGAGLLIGVDLYESGDAALTRDAFLAAGMAFVAALAAIAVMMAWLRRASFAPFVVYRLVLGLGLLVWVYLL